MLAKLPFMEVGEQEVTTSQILSEGQECVGCYITLASAGQELKEKIDGLEWIQAQIEKVQGDDDSLEYRCKSTAAAVVLKELASEMGNTDAKIQFEVTMSADAPDFMPPSDQEQSDASETKQKQISQLYQYYSNLIAQQDPRVPNRLDRARLGNPNLFEDPARRSENFTEPSSYDSVLSSQNPLIKTRYSTKQLLQVFKSLGRFQHPCEAPEMFDIHEVDCLKQLCNAKPCVVLQHLRNSNALPVMVGHD